MRQLPFAETLRRGHGQTRFFVPLAEETAGDNSSAFATAQSCHAIGTGRNPKRAPPAAMKPADGQAGLKQAATATQLRTLNQKNAPGAEEPPRAGCTSLTENRGRHFLHRIRGLTGAEGQVA